jgi:hypothetical protein
LGLGESQISLCSYQFHLGYDAYILLQSWLKHFLMKDSLLLLFLVSTDELNLLLYHNEHPKTNLNKYRTQLFRDGFCIVWSLPRNMLSKYRGTLLLRSYKYSTKFCVTE